MCFAATMCVAVAMRVAATMHVATTIHVATTMPMHVAQSLCHHAVKSEVPVLAKLQTSNVWTDHSTHIHGDCNMHSELLYLYSVISLQVY